MDDIRDAWVRGSDAQEERKRLSEALKGWWKLARPVKALGLYRKLLATTESSRRARNERLLHKRLADPALANLNEDQRRAVIVQEDRTLIVAGAGTGKTHTMVAKARDSVRTGIARPEEIAFVTFTRKAAQEIRDRSGDLPGMEIGTIHHLARVVIMVVEGRKPRLAPLVEDETRRLTQIEAWLAERSSASTASCTSRSRSCGRLSSRPALQPPAAGSSADALQGIPERLRWVRSPRAPHASPVDAAGVRSRVGSCTRGRAPAAMWGRNAGVFSTRRRLDTRGSVEHACPSSASARPACASTSLTPPRRVTVGHEPVTHPGVHSSERTSLRAVLAGAS